MSDFYSDLNDVSRCWLHRWVARQPVDTGSQLVGTVNASGYNVFGFAMLPDAFRLFKIGADGTAMVPDKNGRLKSWAGFQHAYEVKLFSEHFEMRWRRDGSEAVVSIVSDDEAFASNYNEKLGKLKAKNPLAAWRRNDQYVVWGEVTASSAPPGWSQVYSRRVGHLWVPHVPGAATSKMTRIAVKRIEYLVEEETFGNVVPWGERLTGFVDLPSPSNQLEDQVDGTA
jgi:CRISPR-associated protein (TIGR03984 family)